MLTLIELKQISKILILNQVLDQMQKKPEI